jgi:NAD(P)-dependent dehydrogenase (short-subunit alcohol dehydrogenase family)
MAALTTEGYRVRLVPAGALPQEAGPVCGVLNLLGLEPRYRLAGSEEAEALLAVATETFRIVKRLADNWQTGAVNGGGWFINVTALDGHFGLGGDMKTSVAAAGTLGVVKTLGREYPRLRVKNLDVEPNMPADMLAARLLQELTAEDDLIEVGLTREGRWRPELRKEPVPPDLPPLALDCQSVILVTGGARGITAEIARRLAVEAKPRLILVGRSPLPMGPAPRWSMGLDRIALRKLLLDAAREGGGPVLPAEIECEVNRILRDRQIRSNLDACKAAGAEVEYHALDVRDGEAFGRLIDSLYERFGRIDGVIHGAGIIDDRRIRDKSLESFTAVFRTKVDSAWTLARKLRPESLKFLAFFGSVSGRFGNAGQVDYSAANEVLNKLANHLHRRWPGRVVCLNWGPWEGGMVFEELRWLYAGAGIELISVEQGVAAFLAEIRRTDRTGAEVVLARGVERMLRFEPRR